MTKHKGLQFCDREYTGHLPNSKKYESMVMKNYFSIAEDDRGSKMKMLKRQVKLFTIIEPAKALSSLKFISNTSFNGYSFFF